MNFLKMHGLGNDFVILDQRNGGDTLMAGQIKNICDRHKGVGCDQLIVMEPSDKADLFMRIYNGNGTEAEACGNATRCVAHLFMSEQKTEVCTIETLAGLLPCRTVDDDWVEVDMGPPKLDWKDIPLAKEKDTLYLGIGDGPAQDPVAVNVGNPHCVFFVENLEDIPVEELGPVFENNPLYPQKTNVEFAHVLPDGQIRLKVWERGAGLTQACGSAACATIVAAVSRGLSQRKADIIMDGGHLVLEWREQDGHILMAGPVSYVFDGVIKAL